MDTDESTRNSFYKIYTGLKKAAEDGSIWQN